MKKRLWGKLNNSKCYFKKGLGNCGRGNGSRTGWGKDALNCCPLGGMRVFLERANTDLTPTGGNKPMKAGSSPERGWPAPGPL